MTGEGASSVPTIVSAAGSASITFGMTGATSTGARRRFDGDKPRKTPRRELVVYDEEEEILEIVAMAMPMLHARGLL
jgi:hypothetical protein